MATPLVNKFYKQYRGRGRATKQDQNWVVKLPHIVAACRVQQKAGVLFLSSVLVAPEYRGQGIAKALLKDVLLAQQSTVYTFAYRHLCQLYQQLGFQTCDIPHTLQPYFNSYIAQKRDIVAMCLFK